MRLSHPHLHAGLSRRFPRHLFSPPEELPHDPAFRERHCRLLFEHFAPSEAEPAFRELLARDPQNAAAHHNLGSILYKLGRFDEAIASYKQSLVIRRGTSD